MLPPIFIFSNEFIYPFMIACIPVFAIQKPNNESIQTNANLCVCCCFFYIVLSFLYVYSIFRSHLASFDGCPTSDSIYIDPRFQCI